VAPADDEYVHAVHHDDPAVRAAARRSPTSKNPGRRPARSRPHRHSTAISTATGTGSRTMDTADGTSRSAGGARRRPTVRAQHPGRCPSCRGGWRVGTWITLVDETWVHWVCADGQRPAPKWTRTDSPEARAYKAAAAAGEPLPRRRSAWTTK
jgi:hypothetical protein